MLDDVPRTVAYQKAILGNKTYFKDKIVMDVGCGTGILSIFCAQAGAKKVYAVEASNLANIARDIVRENKFEEIIEVLVLYDPFYYPSVNLLFLHSHKSRIN